VKIRVWDQWDGDKETAELAYWERNVLALAYAEAVIVPDGYGGYEFQVKLIDEVGR